MGLGPSKPKSFDEKSVKFVSVIHLEKRYKYVSFKIDNRCYKVVIPEEYGSKLYSFLGAGVYSSSSYVALKEIFFPNDTWFESVNQEAFDTMFYIYFILEPTNRDDVKEEGLAYIRESEKRFN